MNAIPAKAEYDNWKPMSLADSGEIRSWMRRALISTWAVLVCLLPSLETSLIRMNKKALVMDAPAPVAMV